MIIAIILAMFFLSVLGSIIAAVIILPKIVDSLTEDEI